MHRTRAYKGSKLRPEKQARQNPKVGSGTGPAIRPYRNRSKCNTGGKCSICSDNKNANYYPTKSIKLAYIKGLIKGKATKYISLQLKDNAINLYTTI
jgi:hypothetical protein